MRMRVRNVGLACALFSLAGCSDSTGEVGWQPEVTSATVEGSIRSPQIGMVTGSALGPDGMAYISDFQSGVFAFDADGRPAFAIDQPGSGPGDLRMPCCLNVSQDGLLWVSDVGNRRYSRYDVSSGGPIVRAVIASGGAGYFSTDRVQRFGEAGVYHVTTVQGGPQIGGPVIAAIDSTGAVVSADTLLMPTAHPAVLELVVKSAGGVSTQSMAAPFGTRPLFAVGEGYVAVASSERYRVVLVPFGGGDSIIVSRDVPHITVFPREADSAVGTVAQWLKVVGGDADQIDIPTVDHKPVLLGLGIDQDDPLWSQRSVSDGAPAVADLFKRKGDYLESRQWPNDIQMLSWASRGRSALGVRTAPLGDVSIVRLEF